MPIRDLDALELNPQERRFVDEFLIDLNGAAAARRAGYTEKSSRSIASKLLTKDNVVAAVQQAMQKRSERTFISQDRVLKEFARIAFSNMRDFARWGASGVDFKEAEEISEDDAACIKEINETTDEHGGSLKIKLHDKHPALVWLAKHLGLEGPGKEGLDISKLTDQEKLKLFKDAAFALEQKLGTVESK